MSRLHLRRTSVVTAALALLVAAAACSSATDPTTKPLSATEARTVSNALLTQVFAAAGGPAADVSRENVFLFEHILLQRSARSSASAAAATTIPINATCPLGGSITGTGTISDDLDANGTGTETATVTFTPQGCIVSTGARNVTLNGAPSIAMTIHAPFTEGQLSSAATVQVGGAFSWAGGTCPLNYTASIAPTGTGTVSGTACGQDVSGAF